MPSSDRAGALFDMDGTLVDSTATVERLWREVAERHGLDAATVLAVAHGVRAEDTMRRFLPAGEVAAAVARLEEREIAEVDAVVPIPGAREYLVRLRARSIPIAVVTSASPDLARARLTAAGIPPPDTLVSAADVAHGKPDPEGYLAAARRLAVSPAGSIVFEDADAGVRAGLAAGATVVVVGLWESESTVGLRRIADYRELLEHPGIDPFTEPRTRSRGESGDGGI